MCVVLIGLLRGRMRLVIVERIPLKHLHWRFLLLRKVIFFIGL